AGLDGVELDRNFAEVLGPGVRRLVRPRRQVPSGDLLGGDGDTLEDDIGVRREFAQRLLDLLPGVDAGGIEVAEMVDVSRNVKLVDVLGRAVQEGQARV